MIYDPQNELTEEELEILGKYDFEEMIHYLDQKSSYFATKIRQLTEAEKKLANSLPKN